MWATAVIEALPDFLATPYALEPKVDARSEHRNWENVKQAVLAIPKESDPEVKPSKHEREFHLCVNSKHDLLFHVKKLLCLFQAFVSHAESSRCSLPFALRTVIIMPDWLRCCPSSILVIVQGPSLFHGGSVSSHFSRLTFSPTFHFGFMGSVPRPFA